MSGDGERPLFGARLLAARRRLGASDGDFVALLGEIRRLRELVMEPTPEADLAAIDRASAEPSAVAPELLALAVLEPPVADAIDDERQACVQHDAAAAASDEDLEAARRVELEAEHAFKRSGTDEDLDAALRATKRRERAELIANERRAVAAAARARLKALEDRGRRELLAIQTRELRRWRESTGAPSLERLAELRQLLAKEVEQIEDRCLEFDALWQEGARLAAELGDPFHLERPSLAGAHAWLETALAAIAPAETGEVHSWIAPPTKSG